MLIKCLVKPPSVHGTDMKNLPAILPIVCWPAYTALQTAEVKSLHLSLKHLNLRSKQRGDSSSSVGQPATASYYFLPYQAASMLMSLESDEQTQSVDSGP